MSEQTPAATESTARRQVREQTDKSLLDYLEGLQGESSIRVTVVRETPKTWKGHNIEGTLETFDEPISEEEIRELFGGGKYKLRIQTPNAKGSYTYAAHRTLKISGDPKLEHLATEEKPPDKGPDVVRETLKLSERLVDRAHKRADRAEERAVNRPEMDPSVELLVRGMQEELRELRRGYEAKDERIHEIVARQGQRGPSDVLLEKMIDGDSARINAIRAQHEAELRTIRERHLAEVDRLFSRSEDQVKRLSDVHAREANNVTRAYEGRIDTLKLAHRSATDGLKLAHQSATDGLKREIAHLERELSSSKTELAALRAKKNKTIVESVGELAAVREALGVFGGDDGSTLDRVLSALMSSPIVTRIGERLAAPAVPVPPPPAPPAPRVAAPRPLRPLPLGDGPAAAATTGLELMEAAFTSGSEPQEFAQSARNLIGPDVAAQLAAAGADGLVRQIAAASPNSPLVASQRGKNWLRAVTRLLSEDKPPESRP